MTVARKVMLACTVACATTRQALGWSHMGRAMTSQSMARHGRGSLAAGRPAAIASATETDGRRRTPLATGPMRRFRAGAGCYSQLLAAASLEEEVDPGMVSGLEIIKYPDPRLRASNDDVGEDDFNTDHLKVRPLLQGRRATAAKCYLLQRSLQSTPLRLAPTRR